MTIYIAYLPEGKDTNIEIRKWYDKNWQIIFRPTNEKLAATLAMQALKAQNNKNIIFRYFQKPEIFNFLKENKWDFDKIKNTCIANNFSLVSSYINAAGIFINQELNTSNISKILLNTGRFNKLTNSIFTQKSDKLKIGDILVCDDDIALVVSYEELISTPEQQKGNILYVGKGIGNAISIKKSNVKNGEGDKYKTISELKKNQEIEILEITQDNWYKIVWPQAINGYAYVNGIDFNYKGKNDNPNVSKTVKYDVKIIIDKILIKQSPKHSSITLGFLKKNDVKTIIREYNDYGLLQSGKGWINLKGVQKV